MPGGLVRSVKEAWEVPRDLVLRRYPPFVTGGPLPRGDIPVFVLHEAEPRSLDRLSQVGEPRAEQPHRVAEARDLGETEPEPIQPGPCARPATGPPCASGRSLQSWPRPARWTS